MRPLTHHERDLYLADRALSEHGRTGAYNVTAVWRLTGNINENALLDRWSQLLEAVPLLASCVIEDESSVVFAPARHQPNLWVERIFGIDADGEASRRRVARECGRAFDLGRGPLIRGHLLRWSLDQADLIIAAHHLVIDEWSLRVTADWLFGAATGAPVASDGGWISGATTPAVAGHTVSPVDWGCGDSRVIGPQGGRAHFTFPADTVSSLTAVAAAAGATRHTAVLAAVGLAFGRNSAQDSVLVGTTVSLRPASAANAVGYSNAMAPVRLDIDEAMSISDYLRRSQQNGLAAYGQARRGEPGAAPSVMVVPCADLPAYSGDIAAQPYPDRHLGTAQFPMTWYVHATPGGGLHGFVDFQEAHFALEVVSRFIAQVRIAVGAFAAGGEASLSTVPTLATADLADVLQRSAGPELPPADPGTTIVSRVAMRAATTPEHVAVVDDHEQLTYAELERRSGRLAAVLVEAGVRPGNRVGVQLQRSVDLMVALLAVLKSGAMYVPLDPHYPNARRAMIIADAGIEVVVTDEDIDIVRTVRPQAEPPAAEVELPAVRATDGAYVIYTSGSTGTPKGVLVCHAQVVSLLDATREGFGLGPNDVWTFFHSYAFDFSVWEIWGCLTTGGTLVVVPYWTARDPGAFHQLLVERQVTVLNQTPSAFTHLVQVDRTAADRLQVRLLVFGGEQLDPRVLLPWFDRYPETACRVENMYGITETTVHCTWHTVTRADALAGSRSVGRPLPGWQLYVLDPMGRPVAPGVAGEIYVGGAGVSSGYLGRDELTRERFPADNAYVPGRLYRSGDRGRYRLDGQLEHLGRLDDQVKVRGHRIELGEIVHALLSAPRVEAATVVCGGPTGRAEGDPASWGLHAYVVPHGDLDLSQVRSWLQGRLPEYMVPATITPVSGLPLTTNGKLDRDLLPAPLSPVEQTPVEAVPAAEDSDLETRLAAIWQSVLGVPVGRADNFFHLGGNSLLAVRLNTALRENGYSTIRLRDVFRHSTVSAMATLIGATKP
ncbi:non-ribosomal peptide synthetase [Micromonospora sp. CA-246542]|uniref:non-ribosomal peptide synthetase n=1 Tax=Micromonospora sp. CA-246542 TaxID=3239959 RepID=UPI003D8C7D6A